MNFTIKLNSMVNRIKIISLLVSFCSILFVKGATETYSSRITGPSSIYMGASYDVSEGNFFYMLNNSPTWHSEFTNQSVKTYIELGWDEALQTTSIAAYDYTITFDITGVDENGTVGATVQKQLTINYGELTQIDKSRDIVVLDGYHKIMVSIVSIYDNNAQLLVSVATQNMYLETRFVVERYYNFPETTQHLVPAIIATENIANNELEINWGYLYGAEAYELEWTYINNYATNFFATGSTMSDNTISFIDRDFELNNTRVRTGFNKYVIPLVYDQGYILYRVRGIGRDMNNPEHIIYGKWSERYPSITYPSTKSTVADFFYFKILQAHDPDKNWQYIANYAEEGKKKEVVSYFDGTLRNRQSVTRVNTNYKTVVGETIYDHQGRASIQTLPVPTASSQLKYFTGFNKNNFGTAGYPYSRLDFDIDAFCLASTNPMNTNSGSSNYYSKQAAYTGTFQDLVPDADKYPFTQTEFEPDNTGRIRRQSGVGINHKLGGGHETMYFYGKPHQEELDRLFSYNVGYKSRYKKNMVVDPNGQVSITYIDPQGRTIATALVGDNPTALEIVADNFGNATLPGVQTLTVDILNKIYIADTDKPQDDNLLFNTGILGPSNDGLMVSLQENVPLTGSNYTFGYTLIPPAFTDGCLATKCYPVIYDLTIDMRDKCGDSKLTTAIDENTGTWDISGSNCNPYTPTTYVPSSPLLANNLPIGTYTVSKKLSVNKEALDEYTQDYITQGQTAGCIYTEADYLTNYLNSSDMDCEVECDECLDALLGQVGLPLTGGSLPSKSTWMTYWIDNYTPATPTAITQAMIDGGLTQALWEIAYEECTDKCTPRSICESAFEAMLMDVSPGGQYGIASSTNSSSVFSSNSGLKLGGIVVSIPWRNPTSFFDLDASGVIDANEYIYLNLDGTPAIVTVSPDPVNTGAYVPEILSSVTPLPDGNGGFYVYPHQLLNMVDFVGVFDVHWAEDALVQYHPEYCYYERCLASQDIISPANINISSEEFDTEMQLVANNSAAQTKYGGYFTYMYAQSFLDPYFVYGDGDIGTYTYSFTNSTTTFTQNLLTYAQNRMSDALTNYQGSGKTMWKVAQFTGSPCGNWYGTDLPNDCPEKINPSDPTPSYDPFWKTFKNLYLSEKQQIQADIADMIAKDMGCYNGNVPLAERRFPNFRDMIPPSSMGEIENDTDYEAWLFTGQCPNAFDLQLLLNGMTNDNLNNLTRGISTPNLPLIEVPAFTSSLYQVISERDPNGSAYAQYEWKASAVGSMLNVDFKFKTVSPPYSTATFGNLLTNCTNGNTLPMFTLDLDYNTHFDNLNTWSNYGTAWRIERFDQFTTLTNGTFDVMAYVEVPFGSPTLTQVVMHGTTCIPLTGCDQVNGTNGGGANANGTTGFNSGCVQADIVNSVGYLFNRANNAGQLNTSNHSVANTDPDFSELSAIAAELSPPNPSSISWTGSGNIYYINNPGIEVEFIGIMPNNIISLSEINPITDFIVEAKVTYLTSGTLPVNMASFPLPIATKIVQFHLNNISGVSSFPIKLTDCCKKDPIIDPIIDDFNTPPLTSDPYSETEKSVPPCVYGFEVIQNCLDVEVKLLNSYGGNITSWGQFSIDYGDGSTIHTQATGTLASALQHTYSTISIQNYTITVELYIDGANNYFVCPGLVLPPPCDLCTYTFPTTTITVNPNCPPPCEGCVPYPFSEHPPKDCYTSYEEYVTFITSNNNTPLTATGYVINTPTEEVYYPYYYISEEDYCANPYKYSLSDYMAYYNGLIGHTTTPLLPDVSNPFFISFNDFVLKDFGLYVDNYLTYMAAIGYNSDPIYGFISLTDFKIADYSAACVAAFIAANSSLPSITTTIDVACDGLAPQEKYCDKYVFPDIPEPPVGPDPCVIYMQNIAASNAQSAYNTYINGVTEDFRERYIKFAVENAIETFTMTHPDQEYHYTLYNYDQGGNLISTVPPRGVDRLNLATSFTSPQNLYGATTIGEGVKTARFNKMKSEAPVTAHNYLTKYHYNTLNQLIQQETPDGGTSQFWYDYLGRLVASQNAEQAKNDHEGNKKYSYTKYDFLGRIEEVGELVSNTDPDHMYNSSLVDLNSDDYPYNGSWPNLLTVLQVTRTYYDEIPTPIIPVYLFPNGQQNLRNRVVRTTYLDYQNPLVPLDITNYERATHYSYDVHGNVSSLVQENRSPGLVALNQQFKKINYTYDLISGNVIQVDYQPNEVDAFYHKYEYDGDNRITNAWTSEDGVIWAQDAKYFYYDHGPLARTEIADDKTQGTDYAYTIQGWLKANNGTILDPKTEMGNDGNSLLGNLNKNIGTDAYGFDLTYYNRDYSARINSANSFNNDLYANIPVPTSRQLYNGNIAQMSVALADENENSIPLMANNYVYDQLNRIRTMNSQKTTSPLTNDAYANTAPTSAYNVGVQYDPNGNIISLDRNEGTGIPMDNLKYYYYTADAIPVIFDPMDANHALANPTLATNKLAYVSDPLGNTAVLNTDIDNQASGNYTYDAIGNLIGDVSEGITDINWTVYGKVKEIKKTGGLNELVFEYDASGNRVTKTVKPDASNPASWNNTYYVRDASGNVMATYNYKPANGTDPEELKLEEHHIYGSSRVAVVDEDVQLSYEEHTFDTGLDGWYGTNSTPINTSGTMEVNTTGLWDGALYDVNTIPGQTYSVSLDVVPGSSGTGLTVYDAGYITSFDDVFMGATGNYSIIFTATTTVSHIKLFTFSATADVFIADNVIIKSIANVNNLSFYKGKRNFELTNHLGNVMSVVTDKKIPENRPLTVELDNYEIPSPTGWTAISSGIQAGGKKVFTTIPGESYTLDLNGAAGTSTNANVRVLDELTGNSIAIPINILSFTSSPFNTTFVATGTSTSINILYDAIILPTLFSVNDIVITSNNNISLGYDPNIISYNDYYPFGSLMPNRHFTPAESYRYGFNGKEKLDEIAGVTGATYDYGFRIYDPRLGRFLSVDPLTKDYPFYTPYQFAGNKPIQAVDLDGLEEKVSITMGEPGNTEVVVKNWKEVFPTQDAPYGNKGIFYANFWKGKYTGGFYSEFSFEENKAQIKSLEKENEILMTIFDVATDVIPVVGIPKSIYSLVTGENPARFGEKLDDLDQGLNTIGLVIPLVKELKYVKSINNLDNTVDIVNDVTKTVDNAKKVGDTANKLNEIDSE